MTVKPEERNVVIQQAARLRAKRRLYAPMYRQFTLAALRAFMTHQPVPGPSARKPRLGGERPLADDSLRPPRYVVGVTQVQIVNGYICFNCADVALAQKGQNPAHPPGSVSNPTGNTPNGPDPLIGPKAVDSTKAITFGGALSGRSPTSSAQAAARYQPGAQVTVSA